MHFVFLLSMLLGKAHFGFCTEQSDLYSITTMESSDFLYAIISGK